MRVCWTSVGRTVHGAQIYLTNVWHEIRREQQERCMKRTHGKNTHFARCKKFEKLYIKLHFKIRWFKKIKLNPHESRQDSQEANNPTSPPPPSFFTSSLGGKNHIIASRQVLCMYKILRMADRRALRSLGNSQLCTHLGKARARIPC